MRRALVCLAATFLLALPGHSATPPPTVDDSWLTSLAQAKKAARDGHKLIFVDLYAEWCGWCKRLDAQVFSTPQFKELGSQLVLLRMDVEDDGDGAKLQNRFEASSLPTSLLLDDGLNLAGRIEGYLPAEAYIRSVQGQIAEHQKFLARYERLRGSSNPAELHALAKDLYEKHDSGRAAEIYARLIEVAKAKPAELGRLQYHLADSLRLAGDYARAADIAGQARGAATTRGDRELVEAFDFLRFRIAQDRGDCKTEMAALESFVQSYPNSDYSSYARQRLQTLHGTSSCS